MIINIDESKVTGGILELRNHPNQKVRDMLSELQKEIKTSIQIEADNDLLFSEYIGDEETLKMASPCPGEGDFD